MFCYSVSIVKDLDRAHSDSFCNLLYDMDSNIRGFDVIGVSELFSVAEGQCLLTGYLLSTGVCNEKQLKQLKRLSWRVHIRYLKIHENTRFMDIYTKYI